MTYRTSYMDGYMDAQAATGKAATARESAVEIKQKNSMGTIPMGGRAQPKLNDQFRSSYANSFDVGHEEMADDEKGGPVSLQKTRERWDPRDAATHQTNVTSYRASYLGDGRTEVFAGL